MRRPPICELPLAEVQPGVPAVTMGRGQWDALLAAAYADGWVLLEVDETERVVKAYRQPVGNKGSV